MIQLHRSDTGQYVLLHPASRTVVVDESLESGYRRIREAVEKTGGGDAGAVDPFEAAKTAQQTSPGGGGARAFLLLVLVLLPFVWLAGLHYSLGTLVDEALARDRNDARPTRADLDAVRDELAGVKADLGAAAQTMNLLRQREQPGGDSPEALRAELETLRAELGRQSETIDAKAQETARIAHDLAVTMRDFRQMQTELSAPPAAAAPSEAPANP